MRKPLLIVLLFASIGAAAQPPGPPSGRGPRGGGPDFLLPPNWWQDASLTKNLKLTSEQTQKLERLNSEELMRLDRDVMAASREMRAALDDRAATSDRIVSAGNRFAALRDQMLRKQIAVLAAQRAVLTHAQWSALQQQLESRRPPPPPR